MTRRSSCLAIFAALAVAPAWSLAAQCDDCVFPGESWEVVRGLDLAEHGWDRETLARAAASTLR